MTAPATTFAERSGLHDTPPLPDYFGQNISFAPPIYPEVPDDLRLPEDGQLTDVDEERILSVVAGDRAGDYTGYPDIQRDIIASDKAAARLGLEGVERLNPESLASLYAAQVVRQAGVIETPLIDGTSLLPDGGDMTLSLKLENTQKTGSYKLRGAANFMSKLSDEELAAGVVAYSAGNHGAAVALAAYQRGIKATIIMPLGSPEVKQERIRRYGGEVMPVGNNLSESQAGLASYVQSLKESGAPAPTIVPPYDHHWTIEGQSTVAVEVLAQSPDVTDILVPFGGGGLYTGVANYTRHIRPGVKVTAVVLEGQDSLRRSLQAKERVAVPHLETWSDGTAVETLGDIPFAYAMRHNPGVSVVTKQELAKAVVLLESNGQIVEPAGALAVAGAIKRARATDWAGHCVALCTGSNIDPSKLREARDLASVDVSA